MKLTPEQIARMPEAKDVLDANLRPRFDLPFVDDSPKIPTTYKLRHPFKHRQTNREIQLLKIERTYVGAGVLPITSINPVTQPKLPTDGAPYTDTKLPVWASMDTNGVHQFVSDCYFESPLACAGVADQNALKALGRDLGNGTAVVSFFSGGVRTDITVNLLVPDIEARYAGDDIGVYLIEKAYAYFRTGANTYASLAWGSPQVVLGHFGYYTGAILAKSASAPTIIAANQLHGNITVVQTGPTVPSGSPVIASHCVGILNYNAQTDVYTIFDPNNGVRTISGYWFRTIMTYVSYSNGRQYPLPPIISQPVNNPTPTPTPAPVPAPTTPTATFLGRTNTAPTTYKSVVRAANNYAPFGGFAWLYPSGWAWCSNSPFFIPVKAGTVTIEAIDADGRNRVELIEAFDTTGKKLAEYRLGGFTTRTFVPVQFSVDGVLKITHESSNNGNASFSTFYQG